MKEETTRSGFTWLSAGMFLLGLVDALVSTRSHQGWIVWKLAR